MKSFAVLGLSLSLFAATSAHAAAIYNESRKYFDENGILVGQQIALCSNHSYYAGNVHTAYVIDEEILCQGAGGKSPPQVSYIVPGTRIVSYTLPGFLGIEQACSIAECESSDVPEIDRLMDKGWTWNVGWGN
ncbi:MULTISPECIES: hypothetical protein [Luteibacter]|uniref:hypothetical protein n=1 Tax=Luteibacter TaxID=242605 RepID=UPI00056C59EA|nr:MULTISPECIES: hypothetical protein [unclassified Luteibacter]